MFNPCKAFCVRKAFHMRKIKPSNSIRRSTCKSFSRSMRRSRAMLNTCAMRLKRATSVEGAIRLSAQHVFHVQRVLRTPHTNRCSPSWGCFSQPLLKVGPPMSAGLQCHQASNVFFGESLQCRQKTSNVGASNVRASNV